MSGRLTIAVLAAVAMDVTLAASAAAGTVTYMDGVFRYRDHPGHGVEIVLRAVMPGTANGEPGRLSGYATGPLNAGSGCSTAPNRALPDERTNYLCVVSGPGLPRYRLTLGDNEDIATISGHARLLRGVIYAGPGPDVTYGAARRVYGGRGDDALAGRLVYGGPGGDSLRDVPAGAGPRRAVLRGGMGDDVVDAEAGPVWAYGGPGEDQLSTSPRSDMLVGGPGRDQIEISEASPDGAADTYRIRDGRRDEVHCDQGNAVDDAFFMDRADEFVFWVCGGRVLFSSRPRLIR